MNGIEHPPTEPRVSSGFDEQDVRAASQSAQSVRRRAALCLASFGAMVLWPLLAILVTHTYFDNWRDASLLFGGITGIPLALLALIGLSETALISLMLIVWVAAAVVPDVWLAPRLTSRRAVFTLLGVQTAFSFAQAAMGALMIFGKAV